MGSQIIKIVKQVLKSVTPLSLQSLVLRSRERYLQNSFSGLSCEEVFDKIYKDGYWGRDQSGESISGAGSYANYLIDPYILSVQRVLSSYVKPIVVDLGCGDFNVGKQLVSSASKYIACDVSEFILNKNKLKFDGGKVSFLKLNLAVDKLPVGDVALVRQVLQHLSNSEIMSFVDQLNKVRPFKCLIVTEHLPASDKFIPNLDKPTGPGIRGILHSGVELGYAPFNLCFYDKDVLLNIPDQSGGVMRTTVYSFVQVTNAENSFNLV
jgi:hypothetical protein